MLRTQHSGRGSWRGKLEYEAWYSVVLEKGRLRTGMVVNTQHTLSLIKLQVALVCALANIKKPLMEADFRNDNYKKKNVQQQRKLT